jgi:hypothetical protein
MNNSVDKLNYIGDTTARSQEVDSIEQLTANQSDLTKYANSAREMDGRGKSVAFGRKDRRQRRFRLRCNNMSTFGIIPTITDEMKKANREKLRQQRLEKQKTKVAKTTFKAAESPTSIRLKNTFLLRHNNPSFDAYAAQMKKRNINQLGMSMTKGSLEEGTMGGESRNNLGGLQNNSLDTDSQEGTPAVTINSHIPQARDGHVSVVHNGKLFIMGGDRHNMPFNDLYMIDLQDFFFDE